MLIDIFAAWVILRRVTARRAFTERADGPKVHDEHDDSMNTKNTPLKAHRDHRVIVAIVWQRRDST
jgi:hypothetical protein